MLAGTLQNEFWPYLALYGSVWNSETGVLHGFSARIFCFFMPGGRIFEPGIRFWIPRSTFWPGDLFGVNKWSRKKWICDGSILSWQFRGNSQTQMNSVVHRIHLGRLLCPKPLFFNYFTRMYHFSGKMGRAPAYYLGHCLFPLWAIAWAIWRLCSSWLGGF